MSDDIELDSSFEEPEVPEDEFVDEEDEDDGHETIRAKWQMDGARTLTEAATLLRGFADRLVELEAEGWQLTGPVEDDYGYIRPPAPPADISPPGERR